MNTIYKVIWNDALRVFQVVNELTRNRGKKTSVSRIVTPNQSLSRICQSDSVGSFQKAGIVAAISSAILAFPIAGHAAEYTVEGLTWEIGNNSLLGTPTLQGNPQPGDTLVLRLDVTTPAQGGDLYFQDNIVSNAGVVNLSSLGIDDWTGINVVLEVNLDFSSPGYSKGVQSQHGPLG